MTKVQTMQSTGAKALAVSLAAVAVMAFSIMPVAGALSMGSNDVGGTVGAAATADAQASQSTDISGTWEDGMLSMGSLTDGLLQGDSVLSDVSSSTTVSAEAGAAAMADLTGDGMLGGGTVGSVAGSVTAAAAASADADVRTQQGEDGRSAGVNAGLGLEAGVGAEASGDGDTAGGGSDGLGGLLNGGLLGGLSGGLLQL